MNQTRKGSDFRIMIVAGEASGDGHAASLVDSLRSEHPEVSFSFFGATGPAMREAGVETVVESDHLSIMGVAEVTRAIGRFWRAYQQLKQAAKREKPDAVILLDWPEFNMRLARAIHRQGLRVIYYISPQLWAWRSYRIRGIRRDVDLLLTILPFEKKWYHDRGVDHVEFVGNPLAGEVKPSIDRAQFCAQHDLDPQSPIVALLPGSRHKELVRILPVIARAALKIAIKRPELQFVVPLAPNRPLSETEEVLATAANVMGSDVSIFHIVADQTYEALGAADAAVVASGTATLETAILGTPMVVVYKESAANWKLFRWMIDVEHFGLVNLIAGDRLATELFQHDLTVAKVEAEIERLLEPEVNREFRERLAQVKAKLGEESASDRAAAVITEALLQWRQMG